MTAHSPKYRDLVTATGRYVPTAIFTFAHYRTRIEFDAHVREAAARGEKNPITYAAIFKRELKSAFGWASAIRGAGQGEAPARAIQSLSIQACTPAVTLTAAQVKASRITTRRTDASLWAA
jgi:hypothetical protein